MSHSEFSRLALEIEQDLLAAIKSGDEFTRDALRFLKSSLKNAEIEAGGTLDEEKSTQIIAREVKRRQESIAAYNTAGKPEMAESEQKEIELLQKYLPEQMGEDEVKAVISDYLAKNPADISQFGRVMGEISRELKGKADMQKVSALIRQSLESK